MRDLPFYMSGSSVNKLDCAVVCPAWMVPPTDFRNPMLRVGASEETMDYKGQSISYWLPHLYMPQSPDEMECTPVLVKIIGGKAYALMMRAHLCCA